MPQDSPEIVVILDRSGSMQDLKADHEGGLRSFVDDQKSMEGLARFTLIQFDSHNPCEIVYDAVPIDQVDKIELIPRGGTPLLDAVGSAIAHITKRVGAVPATSLMLVMIVTDGQENSSHEYTTGRVKDLIGEKEKLGWKFLYLGADVDAFHEASAMGISMAGAANFVNSPIGTAAVYDDLKGKTRSSRDKLMRGMSLNTVNNDLAYTDEDREKLVGTHKVDPTTQTGGE